LVPQLEITLSPTSSLSGKTVAELALRVRLDGGAWKTSRHKPGALGLAGTGARFVLRFKAAEVSSSSRLALEVQALDSSGGLLARWVGPDAALAPNGCNFRTLPASGSGLDGGAGDGSTPGDGGGGPPVIDLSSAKAPLEVQGEAANDQLGTMVMCDINGDDKDDLVVAAARAAAANGAKTSNGRVYVINGQALASDKTIDLSNSAMVDMIIHGGGASDNLGASLACGDLDGNKAMDLVIGAPRADSERGKVYVLLGGSNLKASVDLVKEKMPLEVIGPAAGDRFGEDVAILAFGGPTSRFMAVGAPGHDGLLVSGVGDAGSTPDVGGAKDAGLAADAAAPNWTFKARKDAGAVFLLPGTLAKVGATASVTVAGLAGLSAMQGGKAGEGLGWRVAGGLIDQDDKADLVAAGPNFKDDGDSAYGVVRVLKGRALGSSGALFDCAPGAATPHSVTIYGSTIGASFGWAIAVGDLDNDKHDDIAIGAPLASRAYLFLGGSTRLPGASEKPRTWRVASGDHRTEFVGAANSEFGAALAAPRRRKGDRASDLVAGAPESDGTRGRLFWFRRDKGFGVGKPVDMTSSAEVRLRVRGAAAGDRLGTAVGGGFFDTDDTILDVAGVAPGAGGAARAASGRAYLFKGK